MPYIEKKRRKDVTELTAHSPGELNFKITSVIKEYLDFHGISYLIINDIVGALESSKLEFYRRIVAPYEKEKIKENGDVY